MAIEVSPGTATPSSASDTRVQTPTTDFKPLLFPTDSNILKRSASDLIELVASRASISSAVYVYDVAEQIGFGTLTRTWASSLEHSAPAVPLQTRAGAGLSLVGRLSEGTSQDAVNGSILTAYTTPAGLAAMAGSLAYLPPASSRSRLIVQVPAVTPVGDSFALSPTLASLSMAFNLLPDNVAVLLSATPQESVDFAMLAYKLNSSHVVHIFDHHSASREVGHDLTSDPLVKDVSGLTVPEAVRLAGYAPFEFVGDRNARTVFVLMNGQLALIAKALASRAEGVAVVVVRVLRPWDADELQKLIPSCAEEVHVFDDVPTETSQGPLFVDVFASFPSIKLCAESLAALTATSFDAIDFASMVYRRNFRCKMSSKTSAGRFSNSSALDHEVMTSTADPDLSKLGSRMHTKSVKPSLLRWNAREIGRKSSPPFLGERMIRSAVIPPALLKTSNCVRECVGDELMEERQVIRWGAEEQEFKVNSFALSGVTRWARTMGPGVEGSYRASNETVVRKIAQGVAYGTFSDDTFAKISAHTWTELLQIELPGEVPIPVAEENAKAFPALRRFEFNAIAVDTGNGETVYNGSKVSSWHDAAKHLLFPSVFTPPLPTGALEVEEFPQIPSLHPELPERTYLVTCTTNRRLTPLDYDRNVFHLEFDTEGTGLKYAIGEALGVHGWNDEQEVLDFCAWYGVDPNRLITIPIAQGGDKMHTRTIFQALQQHIDLFGEPPKSFYTSLAPHATKPAEKLALQFIGSPEGSSTFKKLNEKDTVTFAEVLQRYPSAKPGIETLCEMVGDTKPRHYSIASAQSVVGNRVDLLVVTVEWVAPSGKSRYGQCTRYLTGLKIGQKVTVSIKPSVMKLPPDDKQPIIMAGLGTGAAPFRAFLQHRAWLSQQGIEVGPTYYYFGSRHQHQEYLYGEEIEAYILDSTITKAGLAFSRDGPRKVYIQHKMLEDAETLADMLKNKEGVFYLCGPTWPVPDVYEALVGALVKKQGMTRESAGDFLEGLKEEERYVLEVS
ncbi:hypothetical protein PAXINDRAFT_67312 [Paxillus involutus ATCC 200175]|nr:hypothetical protein PAXINDRAFT_67312 [Paxillus involutus ATCC 200175]